MKNRKKIEARNARIMVAGLLCLGILAVFLWPVIMAAGGLLLAAPPILATKTDEDEDTEDASEKTFEQKVLGGVKSLKKQIEVAITGLKDLGKKHDDLTPTIDKLKEEANESKAFRDDFKRNLLLKPRRLSTTAMRGAVSDECAMEVAAQFIVHCERSDKLSALCSGPQRQSMLDQARSVLGINVKTALSTSDIPLPTQYGGEIRELISQFGVVRKAMFPYPIGMGTARPARMGTRPAFGSIAMSAALTEKSPTVTFASLESHKIGGIVRLPREIDEQSIVAMGQFLARYGAVEFARAEDTWGFLADGTATYESVSGVCAIAAANSKAVTLAAGKTKPSDATLEDFRAMRRLVNKAALNGRLSAYYLDTTWETRLSAFKTTAEPNVYQRLPDGSALLDGYPIIWTDVLTPYGTSAAASSYLAVFGALSFWWMGEHGTPRIDTSEHVWFANDQLATRFIEEIDFDYAALDAASVLATPAA